MRRALHSSSRLTLSSLSLFSRKQIDNERETFNVIWDDKESHESSYKTSWLIERNLSADNQARFKSKIYRPKRIHWTNDEFKDIAKYFDYARLLTDDRELHDWLSALATYGVVFLYNVPKSLDSLRRLGNHVGFLRRTHYGEDYQITHKEDTVNVAYLSSLLQMHCDLPYYEYIPGVTLLHCLVQTLSNGAQNNLVDAIGVAEMMRTKHPAEFDALSTIIVNWNDIGKEETGPAFHSIYRAPMICLDYEKQIERVNHSIPQRDSFFTSSVDDVKRWYRALALFVELIHRDAAYLKLEEGTILAFDNRRLLHGRREYEDNPGNRRHVVGAYLDWDEVFSRFRVLQRELGYV